MAQNYEKLAKKSVADLRAIAKELEHDAVKGFHQMTKGDLVKALCTAQDVQIRGIGPCSSPRFAERRPPARPYSRKTAVAICRSFLWSFPHH